MITVIRLSMQQFNEPCNLGYHQVEHFLPPDLYGQMIFLQDTPSLLLSAWKIEEIASPDL